MLGQQVGHGLRNGWRRGDEQTRLVNALIGLGLVSLLLTVDERVVVSTD